MKEKSLLYAQIASFAVSSCSLAFSFMTSDATAADRAGSIIIGIIFWLGLIAGIVLTVLLSKKIKKTGFNEGKIGLIHFFSNPIAIVFDCLMILSLIGSVLIIVFKSEQLIGYFVIALFIFSFEMHCILNGKNYLYIKQKKYEDQEEKKNG